MTQVAWSFRLRAYNGLLSRTSSMRCESADRRCRPQRRERENRCRPVQAQGTPPTQIRTSRTSCAGVPNNGLARLCPIIAAGLKPQEDHNSASAYPTVNRAGCAHFVFFNVSFAFFQSRFDANSIFLRSAVKTDCRIRAHRSIACRTTASVLYSPAAIPGYCDPCPGNKNAIGRSPAATIPGDERPVVRSAQPLPTCGQNAS